MSRFEKAIMIFLISVFFVINTQTCLAASLSAKATYDADNEKLSIMGTGDSNGNVTIVVVPYKFDETTLNTDDVSNKNAVFNMANTDNKGAFSIVMGVHSEWQEGMYKAIVYQNDKNVNLAFIYIDSNSVDSILPSINSNSSQGIASILSANATTLGLDAEFAEKYGAKIGEYMYVNKPATGYDKTTFLKAYTAGLALSMVVSDEAKLDTIIEEFSTYLDIDKEEYDKYPVSIKNETERLFKAANNIEGTAKEIYERCLLLAQINKAESDVAVQNLIIEFKSILGLNTSVYNGLSDYQKLVVFENVKNGAPYESYADVKDAFDNACNMSANNSNRPTGGVAGGGGGSGSSAINRGNTFTNVSSTETEHVIPEKELLWDVKGHWGEAVIRNLVNKKIVSGYPDGSYLPDAKITRAEFSKLICTALRYEESEYRNEFSDVLKEDWYAPYVLSLSEKGIITGYDGRFDPNANISRQDAAVMIWRAIKNDSIDIVQSDKFKDADEISDYAMDAVTSLNALKVINGYDGMFAPLANATRAEAATILSNLLDVINIR